MADFASHSPHGERGLKCHAYAGLDVDVDSHSPQGECGLKFLDRLVKRSVTGLLSLWRAWIEMKTQEWTRRRRDGMRLGVMHPHIMQGRTVVESPTWRGARHGIVPRRLSDLQWPLIQDRSRVMGLKELRLKRGMTQRELAEKVGMSGGNIAAIECGRRSEANLTLATAIKRCDALRVANPRKLLDSDSESSAD